MAPKLCINRDISIYGKLSRFQYISNVYNHTKNPFDVQFNNTVETALNFARSLYIFIY